MQMPGPGSTKDAACQAQAEQRLAGCLLRSARAAAEVWRRQQEVYSQRSCSS